MKLIDNILRKFQILWDEIACRVDNFHGHGDYDYVPRDFIYPEEEPVEPKYKIQENFNYNTLKPLYVILISTSDNVWYPANDLESYDTLIEAQTIARIHKKYYNPIYHNINNICRIREMYNFTLKKPCYLIGINRLYLVGQWRYIENMYYDLEEAKRAANVIIANTSTIPKYYSIED
jgi:hypothetical protein